MGKTIETRLTEERYRTSDLEKMLNMYTTGRVLRSWIEDFVAGDTGEVVSIERNEVLFERGTLLDREKLSEMHFYVESGDVREVEVSNQKRIAHEVENTYLCPFIASVRFLGKNKKFLLYASDLLMCMTVLKDYIELNYSEPFQFTALRAYDVDMVFVDNLNKALRESEIKADDEPQDKKFYQIEYNVDIDGESIGTRTAIVHTHSVDRAMMLINDYLIKNERERVKKNRKEGLKDSEREILASIESAKTISVSAFVEREFSEAYG